VEFHGETPYPVDYKHGPRRRREHDDLQLCAQAVCLEEMTGQEVPRGAIFHATSQHRREVIFDPALRRRLKEAAVQLRECGKFCMAIPCRRPPMTNAAASVP
jgi:CRISPR-associated exonuclease Cas4